MRELLDEWKNARDGSERTLRRAKQMAGAEAFRAEPRGPWLWRIGPAAPDGQIHDPLCAEFGHVLDPCSPSPPPAGAADVEKTLPFQDGQIHDPLCAEFGHVLDPCSPSPPPADPADDDGSDPFGWLRILDDPPPPRPAADGGDDRVWATI